MLEPLYLAFEDLDLALMCRPDLLKVSFGPLLLLLSRPLDGLLETLLPLLD